MSAPSPAITHTENRHTYLWDADGVRITFEAFAEERDGTIRVEARVETRLAGRLSGPSRLNLLSDRSIKALANTLGSRVDMVDWYACLSQASAASIEYHRNGDPLQIHQSQTDTSRRWCLDPFLEADGWTVLYAQKGSAKSYLALTIALSIASGLETFGSAPAVRGPVAFLDWEGSRREFDVRLTKLRRGLGVHDDPPVYYRHGESSLYSATPGLVRRFSEAGVVAAVVDSKSVAMSGAPMGEAVLEVNRSIRRLGVPVLLIDHKSKGAIGGKDPDMAIGSVHTGNAARMVWTVQRGEEYSPGEIRTTLKNTEANNGPRHLPVEVTFTFDGNATLVSVPGAGPRRVDDHLPVPYG